MSLSKIKEQLETRFPESAFSVNQYPNKNPSIVWVGNPSPDIVKKAIDGHIKGSLTLQCLPSKSQINAVIRALAGDYALEDEVFHPYCTRIGINVIGKKCRILDSDNCVGWTVDLDNNVSDDIKDSLSKRLQRYQVIDIA